MIASGGGASVAGGACLGNSSRVTLRCLSLLLLHSIPLVCKPILEIQGELSSLDPLADRKEWPSMSSWHGGCAMRGASVFSGAPRVLA